MLKRVLILLMVTFGVLFVALLPQAIMNRVPAVEYTYPSQAMLTSEITVVGVVYADSAQEVYLEAPAFVSESYIEVGQQVVSGQLLARIDTDKSQLIANAAREINLTPISGQLEQYQALAGLVSPEQLAAVDWEALIKQYGQSYVGQTTQRTVLLQPELNAPISGTVTQVGIQEGQLFQNGEPAVVISQLDKLYVVVSVSQSDLDNIEVGNRATITASGVGGETYQGTVRKIHPVAKRVYTGTVQQSMVDVEIEVEGEVALLKPGYTVTATIVCEEAYNVLTVPYETIRQDDSNIEYVYVLKGSQMVRQDISTGKQALGYVEVLSGLNNSDVVIVSPPEQSQHTYVFVQGEAMLDD